MEKELFDKINESAAFIRSKSPSEPSIGIILGTGLGRLADSVREKIEIPYSRIPHFAASTVETHAGTLVCGKLSGHRVVMMKGRFHVYEGYGMQEVSYPVRVMRALGVRVLMISNVCGGLSPSHNAGDLMIIRDHVNLMGTSPLVGKNDPRLGPRFPDMCEPYDRELIKLFEDTAVELRIRAHRGVYAALTGPSLETPAEYRFLRIIGADAVGMSTVPEAIVAKHAGMRVFGISVITDLANTDVVEPVDMARIVKTARSASRNLSLLFCEALKKLKI